MNRLTIIQTVETTTGVALMLVVIIALSVFTVNYVLRTPSYRLEKGLERGAVLAPVQQVDYRSSKQTLLLALDTNCVFCLESLPFYRQLMKLNHHDLQMIAIFPNAEHDVVRYLGENNLRLRGIANVRFASLTVHGTPTLILVNADGEITDFWVGELSAREEDNVIRSLHKYDYLTQEEGSLNAHPFQPAPSSYHAENH